MYLLVEWFASETVVALTRRWQRRRETACQDTFKAEPAGFAEGLLVRGTEGSGTSQDLLPELAERWSFPQER